MDYSQRSISSRSSQAAVWARSRNISLSLEGPYSIGLLKWKSGTKRKKKMYLSLASYLFPAGLPGAAPHESLGQSEPPLRPTAAPETVDWTTETNLKHNTVGRVTEMMLLCISFFV